MSPELLDPDAQDYNRTERSDCYALGMVVYEVLSGLLPFYQYPDLIVVGKVVGGGRPERPQGARGAWFTDDVWETLERCWTPQPGNRPGIGDVLQCLEKVSRSWVPLSPRLLAVPSPASSITRGFSDIITVESIEWSGVTSPSQVAPSQPSGVLDLVRSAGTVDRVGRMSPPDTIALLDGLSADQDPDDLSNALRAAFKEREQYDVYVSSVLTDTERAKALLEVFDKVRSATYIVSWVGSESRCSVQVLQTTPYEVIIFKRFRQLCGWNGLLPSSHIIPETLVRTTEYPVAYGGFSDVWEGIYNDERVAIKALRIYKEDDVWKVRKVHHLTFLFPLNPVADFAISSFAKRWRCGSESPIQTSFHSWEFRKHLHPFVWYPSGCRTEMCETMFGRTQKPVDCNWYVGRKVRRDGADASSCSTLVTVCRFCIP